MRRCPPADWRFPHVVGAYTAIVREDASNASMGYLDMVPFVLPLLDISFDQSHVHGPVGRALAKSFANHFLGRGGDSGEGRLDCAMFDGCPALEDGAAARRRCPSRHGHQGRCLQALPSLRPQAPSRCSRLDGARLFAGRPLHCKPLQKPEFTRPAPSRGRIGSMSPGMPSQHPH